MRKLPIVLSAFAIIGFVELMKIKKRRGETPTTPNTPKPSVRRLAIEEEKNLQNSLAFLGNTYELLTALERLYDAFPSIIRLPAADPLPEKTIAAGVESHLALICRRQLTLGALTLFRGYRGDSQGHLRKAIEACTFSAKMDRHPHLAKVWIEVGKSEEAFEEFRKKFAKDLFPKDDAELSSLYEPHDMCSKAMHSSMYGVGLHFIHPQSKPNMPSLDVFDVRINLNVFTWFMIMIRTHTVMLTIFERLLAPYMGVHLDEWHEQLERCKARYVQHQVQWQPRLDEYMKGEGKLSQYSY